MKPLVTFVVPIYNSEQYLAECLDSICAQTYGNWEAVLVNDGSKDHSGEICKKYAESENRFRIIVQNNSGQAKARNTGLKAARGKYVAFIDSDDWIEREYLAFLVSKAESENADMVMCHTMAEYPNGRSIELERMDIKEVVARKTELDFFKLYSYNSGYSKEKYGFINTPWGKLFKIEVLKKNNLYFNDEAKMIEDQLFFSEFLEYADSIGIYKNNLYHYRMLDASAAHRFRENYLEHCMAYLKCNEKLLDKYHKQENIFWQRYYNMVCEVLLLILRNYFFHQEYPKDNYERKRELNSLLSSEPYKRALSLQYEKTLRKETKLILKLLQMHFYGLIHMYFNIRPFLKNTVILIRNKGGK